MANQKGYFQGWSLVGWTAISIGLLVTILLAGTGFTEAGLHLVIRTTAQTSLVLFLTAFVSSALLTLLPNQFTKWLRRNRRYIGVSFAVSHTYHAAAITALGILTNGRAMGELPMTTIVGGGLAYVFILAMVATSFDGAVRRLGYRRWLLLHTIGMYYIWFIFMFSYGGRAANSLPYALPAILVFLALALRFVAAIVARRAAGEARIISVQTE